MRTYIIQLLWILGSCYTLSGACGDVIYVKGQVSEVCPVTPNGSSWATAFMNLQDALDAAYACSGIQEIWVAQGLYNPTVDIAGNTSSSVPQNRTFIIDDNIRLYGGFRGDESTKEERIQYVFPTILTGDQLGDDVISLQPGAPMNASDNSYNIMRMKNLKAATVIDGFTFQGGNAVSSSSTLSKKIGGAIFNDGRGTNNESNPVITNCTFKHNYALLGGGAVYNFGQGGDANPTFINCDFRYNEVPFSGGAIGNNSSGSGFVAAQIFENCVFFNNKAPQSGGAITSAVGDNATIAQVFNGCTWSDNESAGGGAAVYTEAPSGSGSVKIYSSIAWNNTGINFSTTDLEYDIRYTNYNEAVLGNSLGNLSINPQFIYQNGNNVRLSNRSPLIDQGHPNWSNESSLDRDGVSRNIGVERDMGAYEFLSCPASLKIYVNDDQNSNTPTGDNVDFALRTLDAGLAMACNCDEKPKLYLSKGTYYPFDIYDFASFDNKIRKKYRFTLKCPIEVYGGQPNSSSDSSDPLPSVVQGDYKLNDSDPSAFSIRYDDNSELSMFITPQASSSVLNNLTFKGGSTSLSAITNPANFIGNFNIDIEDCNFTNVGNMNFGSSVYIAPNLGDEFETNVSFENCHFVDNTGQALRFFNNTDKATLLINNCVFENNMVPDGSSLVDIGVPPSGTISTEMDITITNTLFSDNQISGLRGSPLEISGSRFTSCVFDVVVDKCDFIDNNAIESGAINFDGQGSASGQFKIMNTNFANNFGITSGACFIDESENVDIQIINSLFDINRRTLITLEGGGGAITSDVNSDIDIYNCSFWGNFANGRGGAIYTGTDCVTNVRNSAFWWNFGSVAEEVNSVENEATGQTFLSNCLIEEPSCSESHLTGVTCESMIFAQDPLLDADLRPSANSPTIDAGNNDFAPNTDFDFGGQRPSGVAVDQNYRVINNNVDIGAFEYLKNCDGFLILNPSNTPFSNSNGEIVGAWTSSDEITLNPGLETDDSNRLIFDTPNFVIESDYTFYNGNTLEVYSEGCDN